ncbi:MAG: pseudouridine synthase [Candidatus Muiribacteriota bacterium]
MEERINKILSNMGVMSRREADRALADGKVIVNGKIAKPGDKIDITIDTLIVNKKQIKYNPTKKYLILNKPAGYLCTHKDPEGRPTIFDLLKTKKFISYVGRLDYNSEGLVLLTNDGEMKEFLSNPKNQIEREYKVKVSRVVTDEDIQLLMKPTYIDGRKVSPVSVKVIKSNKNNSWISIVVKEGINREIRKICEKNHLFVARLVRVRFGPLKLIAVPKGQARELIYDEVKSLKKMMK